MKVLPTDKMAVVCIAIVVTVLGVLLLLSASDKASHAGCINEDVYVLVDSGTLHATSTPMCREADPNTQLPDELSIECQLVRGSTEAGGLGAGLATVHYGDQAVLVATKSCLPL